MFICGPKGSGSGRGSSGLFSGSSGIMSRSGFSITTTYGFSINLIFLDIIWALLAGKSLKLYRAFINDFLSQIPVKHISNI